MSSVQVFVYVKCARSRCHVGDFHQRQPPRGLWFQIWDFHLENLDFKVFLFLFVCFIVQASTGIFIQEFSILNNLILSNFFCLCVCKVQLEVGGSFHQPPENFESKNFQFQPKNLILSLVCIIVQGSTGARFYYDSKFDFLNQNFKLQIKNLN